MLAQHFSTFGELIDAKVCMQYMYIIYKIKIWTCKLNLIHVLTCYSKQIIKDHASGSSRGFGFVTFDCVQDGKS